MLIGGFQKCSLIEYPGEISAVLFTQGCNYRCPYCHNPELVYPELYSSPIAEETVNSFMKRRAGALDALVITGGEPCLQKDLLEFIGRIKGMGFKVKLDTNGSRPDVLERAAGLVDFLAMDVKAPLEAYPRVAGADGSGISRSIEIIKASGLEYEFRTTVAEGLFTAEDIEKIGELIKGAKKHYLQNFLISEKTPPGMAGCSEEKLYIFQEIFKKYIDDCRIR